ncbi:MAG: 50S ribosomal protein L18 [bacterium]|jgi:large subunit ribosomal protein L18
MKKIKNIKTERIANRHRRIRAKVIGTTEAPRLAVFRSNKNIYAQIIDDSKAVTLVAFTSAKAKGKTFIERAKETGIEIAKLAIAKNISKVVFDRGGFSFTGKIKALADGAREGGLNF